jgi:large subunit ribosomal protein L20
VPRAGNAPAKLKRRKRILKRAEGYWGARHRCLRVAREAVMKAEEYAARDRRNRKRDMRSLWITRLNAACRERGTSYSRFIKVLKDAGVEMNRKQLSELAIHDPRAFDELFAAATAAAAEAATTATSS